MWSYENTSRGNTLMRFYQSNLNNCFPSQLRLAITFPWHIDTKGTINKLIIPNHFEYTENRQTTLRSFYFSELGIMSFLPSLNFGSRSSKTFKPKKNIPEGSHQHDLMKHAAATLGSGNLRLAVMLPEGVIYLILKILVIFLN